MARLDRSADTYTHAYTHAYNIIRKAGMHALYLHVAQVHTDRRCNFMQTDRIASTVNLHARIYARIATLQLYSERTSI